MVPELHNVWKDRHWCSNHGLEVKTISQKSKSRSKLSKPYVHTITSKTKNKFKLSFDERYEELQRMKKKKIKKSNHYEKWTVAFISKIM